MVDTPLMSLIVTFALRCGIHQLHELHGQIFVVFRILIRKSENSVLTSQMLVVSFGGRVNEQISTFISDFGGLFTFIT